MAISTSNGEPLNDQLGRSRYVTFPGSNSDQPDGGMASRSFASEIAAIFSSLNVDPPEPDVDLIATGLLDSLSIVGLITELEARYRVRIPLDQVDLDRIRTTRGLQKLIEEAQGQHVHGESAVLTKLRPGSGRPVFLLHTSWGRVQKELPLVLKTERPLYGFQAEFLRPDSEAPLTLEALAASYVRELRNVQPDGPYTMVGFSFGGLLAYEMAVQLVTAGQHVDLLGMVDAEADVAVLTTRGRLIFRSGLALYRLRRVLNPARVSLNVKRLRSRSRKKQWDAGGRDDPFARAGLPADIRRSIGICQALGTQYRPASYRGDAVLLVAAKRLPWEVDPRRIWSDKVKGSLRTVTFPGGHSTLSDDSWESVRTVLSPLLVEPPETAHKDSGRV